MDLRISSPATTPAPRRLARTPPSSPPDSLPEARRKDVHDTLPDDGPGCGPGLPVVATSFRTTVPMPLSPEQQHALAAFPPVLRALVETELTAGNEVVEIGNGFPAPPVGARVLLARKITTRPRESGDDLVFYERNGSLYSGEFTDAQRFFFVLEPPAPPPPEPDMDAIREKAAGGPDPAEAATPATPRRAARKKEPGARPRSRAVVREATATGATWLLHFRDRRPPQEIVHQLERDLMTRFELRMESERLVFRATVTVVGAPYTFLLVFEAAGIRSHAYSLRVEATWTGQTEAAREHDRRTSESWFAFWTRDLRPTAPVPPGTGSAARYQALCEAAREADRALDSVAAVQQAIVAALKQGATFATAHKEGGTTLAWRHGKFVSWDHGESEERRDFTDEAGFLRYLRQFYDGETSRSVYPAKVPDLDAWKLILRLLRR